MPVQQFEFQTTHMKRSFLLARRLIPGWISL